MLIKNSIRTWLLAPFIGVFLLPLLITAAFLSWQNYLLEKENIMLQQQKFTVLVSENISSFLNEHARIITSMLNINYLPGLSLDQQKDVLARFQAAVKEGKDKKAFNRISLLDEHGRERVRVSRLRLVQDSDLVDMSSTNEFRIPAAKKTTYFSPIYYEKITGEPFVKISMPVRNLHTLALKGILVTELSLRTMWHRIDSMKTGNSGIAYVTDEDGRIVAHRNRSLIHKGTYAHVPRKPIIKQGISGPRSIICANKIFFGDQALVLITELPTSEAFKNINMSLLIVGLFFLATFLGSLTLGYVVVRQIVRPIESLADTARGISDGDLTQQADSKRMDELGDLALAFNTMTDKLVTSIQDLKKEKDFVKNVIESLTHPFYVIDVKDYTIKLANSAAQLGSLDEGTTCYALTHGSDKPCTGAGHPCPVQEILKTKKPVVVEHVHQVDEVTSQIIEIFGYPVFDEHGEVHQIIEYNIDVTEKRNLESQLYQSQRLESVGVLTGGVAHDFNNLLTTIIGYSQLALIRIPEDDPEHETIEAIYDAAEKASELTRQLLAFSRKQVMDIRVINLNELIQNLSRMLDRLIGEKVEVNMMLNAAIGNIKADPGQIEQVLVNLIVNAKDAMPEGGTVYLESNAVELDEEYCKSHANITQGSYIVVSVTDTGMGMPPSVLEKIFDPFFTTKKKGEGTGLGLSTVYGIVKQLKGHIYVYSEPDSGTTFKIYFPEEKGGEAEPLPMRQKEIQPGTETILVVDDEEAILRLISDTLKPIGYEVFLANCAEDALEIARKPGREIDLLLTDVIMTTMNGRELATAIEPLQPDIEVLFMSGYTDNIIAKQGILKYGVNFIPKPLVPTILTEKIRNVLDDRV